MEWILYMQFRWLIVLIVGIVAPLPILVRVLVRPRLLLARTPQTKLQWQLLLMVMTVTKVDSLMTAMTPPTM
jgi:hypothetical protein